MLMITPETEYEIGNENLSQSNKRFMELSITYQETVFLQVI